MLVRACTVRWSRAAHGMLWSIRFQTPAITLDGDVQNTIVIDLSVMIGEAYREQFVSSSTLVMCGRFMGGLGRSFGLPQLFLAS